MQATASLLRLLFLGDIVGEPGRTAVIDTLAHIKECEAIDFIVVNGENVAGGRGITPKLAIDLLRAGAAVITTGDHIWDQSEIIAYLPTEPRLLRPLNYPPQTPGFGSVVLETAKGPVAVIQAQGRTFMQPPLENPFVLVPQEVAALRERGVRMILLDFHAETTSEKIAMGRLLDGSVSVVVGTHTHVQTADDTILPEGTGYLTDAGMCGPIDSILGRVSESVVWRFCHAMPTRFPIARGPVALCGLIADIDVQNGRCMSLRRYRLEVPEPAPEPCESGPLAAPSNLARPSS